LNSSLSEFEFFFRIDFFSPLVCFLFFGSQKRMHPQSPLATNSVGARDELRPVPFHVLEQHDIRRAL
jgi:hypothetical protein